MSLLERVIRGHRCRSTHHFIAMDALDLISGEDSEAWKDLMLVHNQHFLDGAKAPDTTFRDFRNHVCHVSEGRWGGAADKAQEWYAKAVKHLAAKQWSKAAFALGVLSHYYADPLQPFHTGQTEEEGVIHRAVEWSIAKSRAEIADMIEASGYPDVDVPDSAGFVAEMVVEGAELSHLHYQTFIDHYNIDAGVAHPPAGLDDVMLEAIAELVAYATAGFAALVSRAIEEAEVRPPKTHLTLQGYIETLDIPIRWITSKLEDRADQKMVERMYREYQKTGKVIRTLPDDDKKIRKLHAQQILRVSLKALNKQALEPIGTEHVTRFPDMFEAADLDDEAVEAEAEIEAVEAEAAPENTRETGRKSKKKRNRGKRAKREQVAAAIVADDAVAEDVAEVEAVEAERVRETKSKKKRGWGKRSKRAEAVVEIAEDEAVIEDVAETDAVEAEPVRETRSKKKRGWGKRDKREAAVEIVEEEAVAEISEPAVEEVETAPMPREKAKRGWRKGGTLSLSKTMDDVAEAIEEEEVHEADLDVELDDEDAALMAELAAMDQITAEEEALASEDAYASNTDAGYDAAVNADESDDRASNRTPRLSRDDDLVDAPSIGKKTAKRLAREGLTKVADLVDCDAEETAFLLDIHYIDTETLTDWQDQARLMLTVPGLRAHDVQVLVGAGIRSAEELAEASTRTLFLTAMEFLSTEDGERVSREDDVFVEDEVEEWIGLAKQAA